MSFGLSSSTQRSDTPPAPRFQQLVRSPVRRAAPVIDLAAGGSSSATTSVPSVSSKERKVRSMRRKVAARKIAGALKKKVAARRQAPAAPRPAASSSSSSRERKVRGMRRKVAGRKVAGAIRRGLAKRAAAEEPKTLEELPQNRAIRGLGLPLGRRIRVDGKLYQIAERMFAGRRIRYPKRVQQQGGAGGGGGAKKARGVPVRAKGDKVGDVKTMHGKAFRLTKVTTKAGKEMFRWQKLATPKPPSRSRSRSAPASRTRTRTRTPAAAAPSPRSAPAATPSGVRGSTRSMRLPSVGRAPRREASAPLSVGQLERRLRKLKASKSAGAKRREQRAKAMQEEKNRAVVIAPSCISFVLKPACRERICAGLVGRRSASKSASRASRSSPPPPGAAARVR